MFSRSFIAGVLLAAGSELTGAFQLTPSPLSLKSNSLSLGPSALTPIRPSFKAASSRGGGAAGLRAMATDAEIKAEIMAPLLKGNKRWIEESKAKDASFFDKLGTIHTPDVMWIGCADSRVTANEIIGAEAGQVFVHRNIANVVMKQDMNLMSGLQYATDVLEVNHIIVCGHYLCAGVEASLSADNFAPPLETWVSHIQDVYRLHQTELDSISDRQKRLDRLVELHVMEQCLNIYDLALVQNRLEETKDDKEKKFPTPRIHGVVYDIGTGKIIKQNWWSLLDSTMEDPYGMEVTDIIKK